MKHNICKSIFCILLLLLGVSHAAWGETIIYYVNTNNWSTVHCHNWGGASGTSWPGTQMTETGFSYKGYKIWSVVLNADDNTKCIFSNNGSNQTSDLTINTDNPVYYNGNWITKEDAGINSVATYYYRGDKNGWNATAMTNHESNLYAYFIVDGSSQFKCSKSTNSWDYASYNNSFVQTNKIDLTTESGNIKIPSSGCILLYYPNTECNTSNDVIICAATTLPDGCPTAPTNPCLAIYGNFTGNWESTKMTKAEDDKTAKCTINIEATGDKQFGIKKLTSCDSDTQAECWNTNESKITETHCSGLKFGENLGGDATINIPRTGDYIFTWDYTTSTLSVIYPVPATYAVTISAGTGGSVSPSGEQQVGSTAVAIEATPETGYAFDNWAVTGGATVADASAASTTVTATAAGTVTANFKTASYLVDYHANGHSNAAPDDVYVNHGEKALVPTPPTPNDEFTFAGWYTENTCINKYDFNTPVTAELHLYAKWVYVAIHSNIKNSNWETNKFTISGDYTTATCTFNEVTAGSYEFGMRINATDNWTSNGTSITRQNNTMTVASGTGNNKFAADELGDYIFTYNLSTKVLTVTYPSSSTYTVTYDYNGGSGSETSAKCGQGEAVTLPTPDTRAGYDFGGWYTAATDGTLVGLAGASYTPTANITLYAKWTQNASAVTYYFMGNITGWGDGKGRPMTSEAEYAYIKLSDNQSGKNFKIYNANLNNDAAQYLVGCDTTLFDAECGMDESYKGDIALGPELGETHHNIQMPASAPSACIVYLYYPNTSINPSSGYVVTAKSIQPQDKAYYFMSDKTGWGEGKGYPLTIDGSKVYAYKELTAADVAKFKVLEENNNNNSTVYYGGENINNGFNGSNIKLGNDTKWHNATVTDEVTANWFVILYFPNTPINTTNNYYVCASYTLPVVSDPYPVTFGVVDNIGGTLTAKSGNSTIASGSSVNVATFTATPATGYAVEGWYSDEAGTVKIDAAGTGTTYSQAISESNNTVYVKFGKAYAIYYKFNDQKWNDDYYAYIFTDEVWHSDNGVQPKVNRSEYGKMSKYNDSVYYYKFTKSADYPRFAFSWGNHSNDDYFNNIDAVYRTDFHKDMPVFIAERGQTASDKKAHYYNKGVWMKFNDTDPGYNLCLTTDNGNTWDESYRFTAAKAGDYISTVNVVLTKDVTYKFWVKNDKPYYFKTEAGTCTSDNHQFTFYVYDNGGSPITITPAVTGTYTFQLNLANGKVEIDVIYPTTEYRLIYVEKSGSTFVKFHPSHTIAVHDAGCDTVSLHVRPNVKDAAGTESVNPNTCEVWLQQFVTNAAGTGMEWRTLQQLDVKNTATITGNGVYNFVLEQNGGITMPVEKIHLYTGNYFIRSEASKAGWDFASAQDNLQNRFWYSDYARQHETFDYYCCHWTTNGTNLNFVVANAYSYCITDTLVQNTYEAEHNYVDATGKLLNSANIRFMWNSYDNSTDRAYLAGAGDNLFLLSEEGIYDLNGTQQTSLKFADQQNWVYRLDVKSDPNAFIKIKAPYAGYTQYFKGSEAEYSFQLIKGLAGKTYNIRVIYDFKTNHLICAWLPEGEITDNESIETDMMIIRQNQGDARQLTFNPTDRAVGEVKNVYCVLTLTKEYLSADTINANEKKFYWLSFPFDVRLSEVFGCGVYSNDYVIQYYDGAERAAKGCWADSPTYWRYYWVPTDVILKKGMGYVLYIDWEQILAQQFTHGNTEVSIYFPSANTEPMDISGQLETVEIPEYKCTIERCDRYIYDSNWNIIGVPAYANIDKFGNPMIAKQIEGAAHGLTVGFVYVYQPATYSYYVAACQDTTFRSMQAYMVQFGGTINWQEKSVTGEVVPSQRMMRAATPDEEADRHTLRLVLQNAAAQQVDHTYIRTQETNVTAAFDLNYDLTKQFSSGANVYSLVGENRITLAANVLPMTDAQQGVSIGVTLPTDGVYTLALPDGTDGLNVVLYDRTLGTYTDLSLAGYTFEAAAGTLDTRFELIVKSPSVTTQMTDATAPYVVYVDNGIVRLEGVETGTTVRLFDAVGRLVWARLADGNLEIPAMAAGTYLLQIGNAVEKIVIR